MLKALEGEIRGLLDAIARDYSASPPVQPDGTWTRDIKQRLCDLGRQWGCDVSATGCEGAYLHHWLLDVVLSRGRGDELLDVLLVMGSEWSRDRDEITWDFGELLLAKAGLKLFLYQQPDRTLLDEITATLERLTRAFRRASPGERYLLAGFSCADGCFEYTSVVI